MPKHIYCSYCGMELNLIRRSLVNRGVIVDLVDPHECNDEFIANITDSSTPMNIFDLPEKPIENKAVDLEGVDKRPDNQRHQSIKSTAPSGVLNSKGSLSGDSGGRDIDESNFEA